MQTACGARRSRISAVIIALLVLGTSILGGCKSRQLTRPTIQMDIDAKFWVRVLLLDDVKSCTFKTAAPFGVSKGPTKPNAKTADVRFDNVNVPVKIGITNGMISVAGQSFMSEEVVIFPDKPHIFTLNGKDYRGNLRLIVNADGSALEAINLVPPEPYLAGVVGAEMPAYWEAEALKAQTIAARTYCFYIKKRFGVNRNWDVKQTAASQVYLGLVAESARVWKAVNKTKGQVLVCKHNGGERGIFPTYYSSTCGGHTENSENVFGDSFEPLTGVPCPYCEKTAAPKLLFWPMIRFDKAEVQARLFKKYPALEKLKKIASIEPAEQSDYEQFSRLTRIKLVGSNGRSDTLRAEDFRLTVDPSGRKLKSTICKIISWDNTWAFLSGRGWGHGVGMCQYGAEGMARDGSSTAEILAHYYPGSRISKLGY